MTGSYSVKTNLDSAGGCEGCPEGHACTTGSVAPVPCRAGTFAFGSRNAECELCRAGSYQNGTGASSCLPCGSGSFCPIGASLELPAACEPGTYGNVTDGDGLPDCFDCPAGSSCPGGAAPPTQCAAGTVAPAERMKTCDICAAGTYQDGTGATRCRDCDSGHYCTEGASAPLPCPHPLGTGRGSVTCSVCKREYYLLNSSANPADIFDNPTKHCKRCPKYADCSARGTTLQTLGVPPGLWRASSLTTELHACVASDHCNGSGGAAEVSRRRLNASGSDNRVAGDVIVGEGCNAGHTGPRCEWCRSESQYFDRVQRGCVDCPSAGVRFANLVGIVLAAAATGALFYLALTRVAIFGRAGARAAHRLSHMKVKVGFQPKVKVLVSFYQIAATLGPVYGVRLHDDFTRWMEIMDAISFDFLGLTYPDACIGSMRDRLLLSALWPYIAFLMIAVAIASHSLTEWLLSGRADNLRRDLVRATQSRLIYWAILVAYLVLPSVSRSIFKSRLCESYDIDAFTGKRRSYLVADLDVLCSADDDEYRGLDHYFWAFFVLWPVLVPLAFLALLLWIRNDVRGQRVGPVALACRFLWRDYDPAGGFLFWEVRGGTVCSLA